MYNVVRQESSLEITAQDLYWGLTVGILCLACTKISDSQKKSKQIV